MAVKILTTAGFSHTKFQKFSITTTLWTMPVLTDALNMWCYPTSGQHWVRELSHALYTVNSNTSSHTKLSPFELLYGYRPLSAVDFLRPDMDYDCAGWDYDEALHAYLSKREADRGAHGDMLRQRWEKAEAKGAADNPVRPQMGVGGWVMLHKDAFSLQLKESKLVSKEAHGQFRVLELHGRKPKGRIRVALDNHYTKGWGDVFTLQHIRQFFQKRSWNKDQISLAQHMVAPWEDGAEYEVDKVDGWRFAHGQYKYSVSYKGRLADHSHYLRCDDPRVEGCQRMLAEYDETYPRGVLPKDKAEERRVYMAEHKASRKSGRLTNRRVDGSAEVAREWSRLVQRQTKAQKDARRVAVVARRASHDPGGSGPTPEAVATGWQAGARARLPRVQRTTFAVDDVRHPEHRRRAGPTRGAVMEESR